MNEDKPIRLIRACTEDTGILTSTIGWFDSERDRTKELLATAKGDEILMLQGEARCLYRLRSLIAQMTKAKGELLEQQPIRRFR